MQSLSPGVVDTGLFDAGGWNHIEMEKMAHLSPDEVADGLIAVLSVSENVVVCCNLISFNIIILPVQHKYYKKLQQFIFLDLLTHFHNQIASSDKNDLFTYLNTIFSNANMD